VQAQGKWEAIRINLLLSFTLACTYGPRENPREREAIRIDILLSFLLAYTCRPKEWRVVGIPHLWPKGMGGCWNESFTFILIDPHLWLKKMGGCWNGETPPFEGPGPNSIVPPNSKALLSQPDQTQHSQRPKRPRPRTAPKLDVLNTTQMNTTKDCTML